MITINVNGEARQVAPGMTLGGLLASLGLHPRLVVVEHNREILDATHLDATEVRDGDNVEVVHFVGGG
jgi:thiamine biosynthesis protein ThiS